VPLPDRIPLRYSDESAGYDNLRPLVNQTFRLAELIDMVVSVVGKDAARVQQTLRTGIILYNGYRYSWESLSADLPEVAGLLAAFPDDDPSRSFDATQASSVLLESGGGTQRVVTELSREDASRKKLFGKQSPWDLLLESATATAPHYEKYSHARRADLFRLTLPYDRGQQILVAMLDAAPRTLRRRWNSLRPPAAITFVCPR
jgi:hypothetical protein